MSRDLTVNKRSLGNSRPSFLVATATIANPKSVDLTVGSGGLGSVPPAVFLLIVGATAIYMSRDLTVNKRSLVDSRPSFLVATATIATHLPVDQTA